MICRVARAHAAMYRDILPAFNGGDGTGDGVTYLQDDHTHANALGAELIARLITESGSRAARLTDLRRRMGCAAAGATLCR